MVSLTTSEGFCCWILSYFSSKNLSQTPPNSIEHPANDPQKKFLKKSPSSLFIDPDVQRIPLNFRWSSVLSRHHKAGFGQNSVGVFLPRDSRISFWRVQKASSIH